MEEEEEEPARLPGVEGQGGQSGGHPLLLEERQEEEEEESQAFPSWLAGEEETPLLAGHVAAGDVSDAVFARVPVYHLSQEMHFSQI